MKKQFIIGEPLFIFMESEVDGVSIHTVTKGSESCSILIHHGNVDKEVGLMNGGAMAGSGVVTSLLPITINEDFAEALETHCSTPFVAIWLDILKDCSESEIQAILAHEFQHVKDMRRSLFNSLSEPMLEIRADMAAVRHAGRAAGLMMLENGLQRCREFNGGQLPEGNFGEVRLRMMRRGYFMSAVDEIIDAVKSFFGFGGQK